MEHEKSSTHYAIAISIVASALILSGVIWVSANGINNNLSDVKGAIKSIQLSAPANPANPSNPGNNNNPPAKDKSFDLTNAAVEGKTDAKVTIVEYSDFQCPFCRKFYEETYKQLVKDYVDTGKVKIYFKNFPLSQLHPSAEIAAEAAECARDQGKFWEMHDKIFDEQQKLKPDGSTATFTAADLKTWASQISGVDAGKFSSCLDSGSKKDIVSKHFNEGVQNGVSGTPSFYVNGQELIGAQPYSAFKILIDQALAG